MSYFLHGAGVLLATVAVAWLIGGLPRHQYPYNEHLPPAVGIAERVLNGFVILLYVTIAVLFAMALGRLLKHGLWR